MWLSNSSVGRRVATSVTGIALVLFLTSHMVINLATTTSAGGYNLVCEFLRANWYVLVTTPGLTALSVIRIIHAFRPTIQDRATRGGECHTVVDKLKTAGWVSQNMLVLDITVILDLDLHPFNFWVKMQLPESIYNVGGVADATYAADGVYHIMNTFSNSVYVVLYLVWLGALWFHLTRGLWNLMQSLGWNNKIRINRWKCISNIYSTVVVVCFALVVVVFFVKSLACGVC